MFIVNNLQNSLFILIIFLPILNFFICFFFKSLFDKNLLNYYVISNLILSLLVTILLLILINFFNYTNPLIIFVDEWSFIYSLKINFDFLCNNLSLYMLVVILTISLLVHIYSVSYMHSDSNIINFMSYLSLFTFSMVILVTSNNFFILFIGWEGVGLCSFKLINFWNTRLQANKSALKAILVNKIGDFFLFAAIALLFKVFKTLDFNVIFFIFLNINDNSNLQFYINIIALLLLLAAMTKSAQLMLHTWLPDAMEGPTPVSALLHAATMVTAGIFLIIKCSFIFEKSPLILEIMVYVGILTTIFSSLIGLAQYDIKKIIAFSTCSQLGYMFLACGLSAYHTSLFHLFNHAFFKALLFLSAGSIIHSLNNQQDIRKMGGLRFIMPFTYICFITSSLSLMGFPFYSGFYSKDSIFELLLINIYINNTYFIKGSFLILCFFFTLLLTIFYSYKILFFVFFNKFNFYKQFGFKDFSSEKFVFFSFCCLLFLSITSGFLFKKYFDFDSNLINSIFMYNFIDQKYFYFLIKFKFFPLILLLMGFLLSYCFYNLNYLNFFYYFFSITYRNLIMFFNKKMFFDDIFNFIVVFIFLTGNYYYKIIDKGLLQYFGPLGLSNLVNKYIYNVNYFYNNGSFVSIFINLFFIIFVLLLILLVLI